MLNGGLSSTSFWHLLYSVGMFSFAPKVCTDTILHFWVFTCQGIVQYVNGYTKASKGVPDSFLQNHNLVSSFTCRPWFNSYRQQFYFKLEWLELAAGAPLDSCMLQAIREDCLNHKPFSISASFFFAIPLGISFISCSYSQPPRWLTVNDYFPFCLQPFTAYFYIQRYSIGDVSRIEIKKSWCFAAQNIVGVSYGDRL